MPCPHCGTRATLRTSKAVTPTYRTLLYRCDNDDCGHSFVAQLAVIHSTRASAMPNPAIDLPLRLAAAIKGVDRTLDITPTPAMTGLLDQIDAAEAA